MPTGCSTIGISVIDRPAGVPLVDGRQEPHFLTDTLTMGPSRPAVLWAGDHPMAQLLAFEQM